MNERLDDAAEADVFSDPTNRRAAGQAIQPSENRRRLSSHVPVRFAPDTIARVRVLAEHDGQTVSTWIRQVVERTVAARFPVAPLTGHLSVGSFINESGPSWPTETRAAALDDDLVASV